MQAKKFTLINRGMNRDLSISKTGQSVAFENHNVRIMAGENDTLLSVTNERGTKALTYTDESETIQGKVLGWNKLNRFLILFTKKTVNDTTTDYIFRIEHKPATDEFECITLFEGDLNFDSSAAIESVVDYESESVQKIYWVDGVNVLRCMNFVADGEKWYDEESDSYLWPWQTAEDAYDSTYFDCNRGVSSHITRVLVTKDGTGVTRPNGTVQYFLTYYNQYGQETGIIWSSDIIYLTPTDHGGAADGTNTNNVKITFPVLSSDFDHFKVYSIFRSSFNGSIVASLIADMSTNGTNITIADDGSHHTAIDAQELLYLGSKPVVPGTLESKDSVLFIGDLQSTEHNIDAIKEILQSSTYISDNEAQKINFVESDNSSAGKHIPYVKQIGLYPYNNQLEYTDSEITTFKYGEKYRFAIKLFFANGDSSEAIWIGDKVNNTVQTKYQVQHPGEIVRAIARFEITTQLRNKLLDAEVKSIQLLIAEATYSDRSIIAQGVINPTVYNTWNRYNDELYAMPSWVTRARNSGVCCMHNTSVYSSGHRSGEIQCNIPLASALASPFLPSQDITWTDKIIYTNNGNYVVIVRLSWTGAYFMRPNVTLFVGIPLNDVDPTSEEGLYSWDFNLDGDGSHVEKSVEGSATIFTDVSNPSAFVVQRFDHTNVNKYLNTEADRNNLLTDINSWLESHGCPYKIGSSKFSEWCSSLVTPSVYITNGTVKWFNVKQDSATGYGSLEQAATCDGNPSIDNWVVEEGSSSSTSHVVGKNNREANAYYRKNLMFIDEGIVTFNSPEIEYGNVSVDNANYSFRVIGIAKVSSGITDYTVDASMGKLSGDNLYKRDFSNPKVASGRFPVASWPLWTEKDLEIRDDSIMATPVDMRDSDFYKFGYNNIRYWLYMWQKAGVISGYRPTVEADAETDSGVSVSVDDNISRYSYLRHKVFANMTYCYSNEYAASLIDFESPDSIRVFNGTSSQYTTIKIGGLEKYYDGVIDTALTMPTGFKYPIFYSSIDDSTNEINIAPVTEKYLYTDDAVRIQYATTPHAVISLGATTTQSESTWSISQTVLPKISGESYSDTTGALCWDSISTYVATRNTLLVSNFSGAYLLLGEIYRTFNANADTRYGGTSEAAIKACRFIPASKRYNVTNNIQYVYGDKGDTYYQRYDCLRTVPFSDDAVNNVIDVVSFMVETHINLDGRTGLNRGKKNLASIDTAQYGALNLAYSQRDNFMVSHTLDNKDSNYRSSISWTLPKHAMADTDEWQHITLASSLPLDAEYGICRSLNTFRSELVVFQDRAISEILFNSRVQVSASDGVPIELANSGKVDGTRYLTTNYGCTNKFSIVEGKSALYFVDSINKMFGAAQYNQRGHLAIENISERLGFGTWFREHNTTKVWPNDANAFISFFDTTLSDVYLVRGNDTDGYGTLVYNENLNSFSSFFDYYDVPMMTTFYDRFISFKNGSLWEHRKGLYCNLHGVQYNVSMQYRVAPDPQTDKIWSNIDYRTDFYRTLDANGVSVISENNLIDGGYIPSTNESYIAGDYKDNETFDEIKVWNEYQHTSGTVSDKNPIKKFRIWRYMIPRAEKTDTNKWGLDRIRNPWINIFFKKIIKAADGSNRDLMQLHDIDVTYYE